MLGMKHDRLPSRSSRSSSNWEIRYPLGRLLRIPTSSDPEASVQSRMDAVPLLIQIKVKSCQSSQYEVELIHVVVNGRIDNRVDASISIRASSGCANILEGDMLIKGFGKFVLGSLL